MKKVIRKGARNQKLTKDQITTDAKNKISTSNQNWSTTREHDITELGHNNGSRTSKNLKDKEIANKTDSYNNNKIQNQLRKRYSILLYIIKYVKSHSLSKSLDNSKVYVDDLPGARVRCMQDYVRPISITSSYT